MYIDMEKWKSKNVQQLSLNIINEKSKILNYWDQDILNLIFLVIILSSKRNLILKLHKIYLKIIPKLLIMKYFFTTWAATNLGP